MSTNYEDKDGSENNLEELEPSKSQRKRDALQMRAIAETLVEMQPRKLDKLPLSEQIRYAVDQCPPGSARGARKRQLQFISKLLRNSAELAELQQALENPDRPAQSFHHETMRDNLLASFTDYAEVLLQKYPEISLQRVRQLVRNAASEAKKQHNQDSEAATEDHSTIIRNVKSAKALLKLLSSHNA